MDVAYPDYIFFRDKRHSGYVLAAHADALRLTLVTREDCVPVPGAGRGGLYRFASPLGSSYLRVYRRGGMIRHVLEESYVLENRPLAEFRVHTHLANSGFPVPKLLGVLWHKVGPIYRGAIATLGLEGKTLLEACLAGAHLPEERILRECGALLRRLQLAGVRHADLNASNIFLTSAGPYLLDFDRAKRVSTPMSKALRNASLARLHHSLRKHRVPDQVMSSILSGYEQFT